MIYFTLYSRSYCHLCDEMLAALQALCNQCGIEADVEVVDVDADEALLALYDESVPVLFGRRDRQAPENLCHYFLDEAIVGQFLTGKCKGDALSG